MTIDWSDGGQSAGNGGSYVTKIGGDVIGVTAMLWRECWNGGGYVTTVEGGVTRMMRDLQGHRNNSLCSSCWTITTLTLLWRKFSKT